MVLWTEFLALLGNYILISGCTAWFTAQLIKVIMCLISKQKVTLWSFLFSMGGMPSSHSAFVTGLSTAIGFSYGLGSGVFAVSFGLAVIVMIDASGVRYESGEQAKILNRITKELFSGKPDEINTGLKELIGHTPFQVLMGAGLGISVAVIFFLILL